MSSFDNKPALDTRVVDVFEVWSTLSDLAVIGTGCFSPFACSIGRCPLCCNVVRPPALIPDTATANILSGIAVISLESTSPPHARRTTGRICAAAVSGVSAFMFFTHSFAASDATKHIFVTTDVLDVLGAVGFSLLGSAMVFIDLEWKGIAVAQVLTLAAIPAPLLALLADVYDMHTGQAPDIGTAAIQSGSAIFMKSTGVLLLHPQLEPVLTLATQSLGGTMLGRTLSAGSAFLIVGAFIRIIGEKLDLFSSERGTAIFAFSIVAMSIPLFWLHARMMNRVEAEALRAVNKIRNMNAELERRVEVSASQLAQVERALEEEITERKRAIDALRTSETGYRFLFESNPLPLFVFDHETYGYTAVNQAALEMYGYTREEFLHATAHDLLLPQEVVRLSAYLKETRVGNNDGGIWRSMKKDGTVIDIEVFHHVVMHEGRLGSLLLVLDVTERRKTEIALQEYATRLRILSRQLLNIQEAERTRIARELHDQIGQTLTAVKFQLQSLRKSVEKAAPKRRLEDCIHLSLQALEQVRTLSLDLRPPVLEELGLTAALEAYVQGFAFRTKLSAKFVAGSMTVRPSKETEIACFRLTQEALTNVMRHAKARHVTVRLLQSDSVLDLEIRDDGVGFDLETTRRQALAGKSIGLLSMAERVTQVGGQFDIYSSPGKGAVLRAEFPLDEADINSSARKV